MFYLLNLTHGTYLKNPYYNIRWSFWSKQIAEDHLRHPDINMWKNSFLKRSYYNFETCNGYRLDQCSPDEFEIVEERSPTDG